MMILKNVAALMLDVVDEKPEDSIHEEYEVEAEGPVFGGCVYGPYELSLWDAPGPGVAGGKQRLYLSIRRHRTLSTDIIHLDEWSDTHLHGGDVSDELTTLASLFLRRRVRLGQLVRHGDYAIRPSPGEAMLAPELATDEGVNLSDLMDGLGKIPSLVDDEGARFLLAARLYQQGLFQIETMPDLAFLSFVQAIDVLASEGELLDVEGAEVSRFSCFVVNNLSEEFWAQQEELFPEGCEARERDRVATLEKILKVAVQMYRLRQAMLYKAKSIPTWFYRRGSLTEDDSLPPDLGPDDDLLPYPRFVERLTHHLLLSFLGSKQGRGEKSGETDD